MAQPDQDLLMKVLEQAVSDSLIKCPECYMNIEVDREQCLCGWENLLRKYGFI